MMKYQKNYNNMKNTISVDALDYVLTKKYFDDILSQKLSIKLFGEINEKLYVELFTELNLGLDPTIGSILEI